MRPWQRSPSRDCVLEPCVGAPTDNWRDRSDFSPSSRAKVACSDLIASACDSSDEMARFCARPCSGTHVMPGNKIDNTWPPHP